MVTKDIYLFEEGKKDMGMLLGNKGAQLCEMTRVGIPVPPGFVITTKVCNEYAKTGKLPKRVKDNVLKHVKKIERKTGKKFGDARNPLLFSVRSGAPISMPGMMDTILNLGLNDKTVLGLAKQTNNEWFAYDSYRRFLQMFGNIVLDISKESFEDAINKQKKKEGVHLDQEISLDGMKELVKKFKKIADVPQDPSKQLFMAIGAVFSSWNSDRAKSYREFNRLPNDLGTGVNVQTMVFGNLGNDSGTGVVFTRNPATGEKKLYGEFLLNAQGEDIVAGTRTPKPVNTLKKVLPKAYKKLVQTTKRLEKHYKDVQDIEFTIEKGKLYILQTRTAKRTASAAVKIAVDMVKEGVISKKMAIMRIDPSTIEKLLHRQISDEVSYNVIATGLPASPGAATGKLSFDADDAEKRADAGEKVILVRSETSPDDVHGIVRSQGVLTLRGGVTSHAAVVSRGLGIPCVSGCNELDIDYKNKLLIGKGIKLGEEDTLTIDGTTGRVIPGGVPLVDPKISKEFAQLLKWADSFKKLKVMANADTPKDAKKAVEFGAEGIGLCRTEHMFMSQNRLPIVQEMILSRNKEERERALARLLPEQRKDFTELFKIMKGRKITIRLLDPPLHEFLPDVDEIQEDIRSIKKSGNKKALAEKEELLKKTIHLHEVNPMLGHRGIRLGLVYPEIYNMQVRAIMEAACNVKKRGTRVSVVIELPLVAEERELATMKDEIDKTAMEVQKKKGVKIPYHIGTMIELPRACLIADKISKYVDFISFGTNDLTQTTFGFSRDDAEDKFLHYYFTNKILEEDPFVVLDEVGVGELMKMAVKRAHAQKPGIEMIICGEHGGEPKSVHFCHHINLDGVSCSPYRVPIARLAAAQAAIGRKK